MSPSSRAPEGDEAGPEGPSLREIAQTLTTPALAGMVLTKGRLGELSRELDLPIGFGDRVQMLMGLFRAAGDLERVPALIRALRGEAERWGRRYLGWAEEYPASEAIWNDWRERLSRTRGLLAEMATVADEAQAIAPGAGRVFPPAIEEGAEYDD